MKKRICLLLALALLALAACGGAPEESPTPSAAPSAAPSPTPTPTPAPTPEPTPTPLPYTDPLTGLGRETDPGDARPWAVMINNLEQALPQRGVSQAAIVYEIPAEGGVTRMLGIFTDIADVASLGSMRSLRPYYAEAARAYDAVVVHAGGSDAAYDALRQYGMDHLDGVLGSYDAAPFYRDPDRMHYGVEHSMFADGAKLLEAAGDEGLRLAHEDGAWDYGLAFTADPARQCTGEAEYLRVRFNGYKSSSFVYDAETGLYGAYQYGAAYIDDNTGEQLQFTNLLVLETDIHVLDEVGRLSVRLTGGGTGYFACAGRYTEITWARDEGGAFTYYLPSGLQLRLGAGRSYIAVVGAGAAVDFTQEG